MWIMISCVLWRFDKEPFSNILKNQSTATGDMTGIRRELISQPQHDVALQTGIGSDYYVISLHYNDITSASKRLESPETWLFTQQLD